MAPYESGSSPAEDRTPHRRKKIARYGVPVAVVGVAAATIGLVPALADSGDPELPKTTAQELIEKIATSDTEQLSGTVKISTDLGLPGLDKLGDFAGGGGAKGADPSARLMELAGGTHTLRVAVDGPDRQKVSVIEDTSEYSVIHNGDEVWAYDSASDEAFHATGKNGAHPGGERDGGPGMPHGGEVPATPAEFAEEILKASAETTSFEVDGTAQVAGRDAYKLVVKPKQTGGATSTVGAVTIAVDAKTGTPLKVTLTPAGGGAAVIDAGYTKVDFGKPDAALFDFEPAKGTKVTEAEDAAREAAKEAEQHGGRPDFAGALGGGAGLGGGADAPEPTFIGEGWSTIAEFRMPGGKGLPGAGEGDVPPEAAGLLDAFGDKVKGDFGTGRVFSTRLINALVTDDGRVYAGAVTKDALIKAAESAESAE